MEAQITERWNSWSWKLVFSATVVLSLALIEPASVGLRRPYCSLTETGGSTFAALVISRQLVISGQHADITWQHMEQWPNVSWTGCRHSSTRIVSNDNFRRNWHTCHVICLIFWGKTMFWLQLTLLQYGQNLTANHWSYLQSWPFLSGLNFEKIRALKR